MKIEEMETLIRNNIGSDDPALMHAAALLEISYQLAKLHKHFEKVDSAVFGGTCEKEKEISEAEHRPKRKK